MEFTLDDLLFLEKLRIERFREYLGEDFLEVAVSLDRDNRLAILCDRPSQVDDLLDDPEGRDYGVFVILGASAVEIYFAGEQVWESDSRLSAEILLGWEDPILEHDMVATLTRPTELPPTANNNVKGTELKTLDELAIEIAAATGRGVQELRHELANHTTTTLTFRGEVLIDPAAADAAIDRWADWLKNQLRRSTPAPGQPPTAGDAPNNGTAPTASTPPVATKAKTATKTAAKPSAKTASKTTAKKPAAKKPAAAKAKAPAAQPPATEV
jgi:hypothetical protein